MQEQKTHFGESDHKKGTVFIKNYLNSLVLTKHISKTI